MSTLGFPLLPHSQQYRVKNSNLEFSSLPAVVENNSNWKGTQSFAAKKKSRTTLCLCFLLIKQNLCCLQARWCSWPCHRKAQKTAQLPGMGHQPALSATLTLLAPATAASEQNITVSFNTANLNF